MVTHLRSMISFSGRLDFAWTSRFTSEDISQLLPHKCCVTRSPQLSVAQDDQFFLWSCRWLGDSPDPSGARTHVCRWSQGRACLRGSAPNRGSAGWLGWVCPICLSSSDS